MTNIIEIIELLRKEGSHIGADIIDGHIYVIYRRICYDITTKSLNDQLKLIVHLLEN